MKFSWLRTALTALLSLQLGGCAGPYESSESRRERSLETAAAALEGKSDADSLAAAALLRQRDPAKTLELLARATMIAPDRPDLAWLHVQACGRVPGCESQAQAERLRGLDPTNGAAWLPAAAAAEQADDEAMRLSTLAALARAERVDVYWTTLIVHLTRSIISTGELSSRDALNEVISIVAVGTIPAYRTISQLCAGSRLDNPATLQECRAVALALERGDTDSTEMEGTAIAQRLWSEGSPEWTAANEARRAHAYRVAQLEHSPVSNVADAHSADAYLDYCARSHREQEVEIAILVADGKNPGPPAA
jgi:hypothetical protein